MSVLAPDDYAAFCDGLRRICGVDLSQYRRQQMERRVRTSIGRTGISRLTDCLPTLSHDDAALDALLDGVTVSDSQLFGEPEPWTWLAGALPQLAHRDHLQVWSAGCGDGAEAYSIAAVCHEVVPHACVEILGTDIDGRRVERARDGHFSDDSAASAEPGQLARGFVHGRAGWEPRAALRSMVRFETGDLLRLRPPTAAYDLIFCRDLAIYFCAAVRDRLHARLALALRAGGHLVLGATERVADPEPLALSLVAPFVYRKAP